MNINYVERNRFQNNTILLIIGIVGKNILGGRSLLKKGRILKVLSAMAIVSVLVSGMASAAPLKDTNGNELTNEQVKQLNAVKGATAKYHDVNKAIADGYKPVGDCTNAEDIPPLVEMGIEGTMGIHYFNPSLVESNPQDGITIDDVLTPNQPELLLYIRDKNGNLKLAGVEYMVSYEEWMKIHPELNGYSKEEMEAEYLSNSVSYERPQVFGLEFEGLMAPHGPGEPWHFDKHIWLFNDNPNGIDDQWNPSCTCSPEQDKDKKPFKHSH